MRVCKVVTLVCQKLLCYKLGGGSFVLSWGAFERDLHSAWQCPEEDDEGSINGSSG